VKKMSNIIGLPVLLVEAETIGEAWIKTLNAVWTCGREMPHHYKTGMDKKGLSKEATVTVNVLNPLKEPMVHRADVISYSCCIGSEANYVSEILDGAIDYKVDEGSLSYTYSRRLKNWGKVTQKHRDQLIEKKLPILDLSNLKSSGYNNIGINQIEYLIKKAVQEPISRKLQMTTWLPHKDLLIKGAPCLQRIWIRFIPFAENPEDGFSGIVFSTQWRSRDLHSAWGSNAYGMVRLAEYLCKRFTEEMGMDIKLLQYIDYSNSLHIYKQGYDKVQRIFDVMKNRGLKIE
jgi:thymidylate synthase